MLIDELLTKSCAARRLEGLGETPSPDDGDLFKEIRGLCIKVAESVFAVILALIRTEASELERLLSPHGTCSLVAELLKHGSLLDGKHAVGFSLTLSEPTVGLREEWMLLQASAWLATSVTETNTSFLMLDL